MDSKTFHNVIEAQMKRSTDVLLAKNEEYSSNQGDRLHNFKVSAAYQQCTPKQACLGLMSKHLVNLSDMIRGDRYHSIEIWDEKITDSINYLLLLRGLVEEDLNG